MNIQITTDMEIRYISLYQDGRTLCHLFKEGDSKAISIMAMEMAALVPSNVVLVPIPSRHGYATHTLVLANEISKLTDTPVANILKGFDRQSNYSSKKTGHPLTIEDLGFYKTQDINLTPCFIDNVYDTGITMESAFNAFGKGICLVYSKT